MRRLTRACRRFSENEGFALVAVVLVAALFLYTEIGTVWSGSVFTVRPGARLLDYWLLLVLGASYAAWAVLRFRASIPAAGAPGFTLAAFGLAARGYCHFLLYGASYTWGHHSLAEELADGRLRFLIAVHRYGGLLAFALGLALAAWASRTPGRARPSRSASPRPADPA